MKLRATSEAGELLELIDQAWSDLGQRGTKAEMLAAVRAAAPSELTEYLAAKGINTAIGSYFRRLGSNGLPQAPEVDADGTHASSDQLTLADFGYIVRRHLDSSEAHAARAQQWVDACVARYGREPLAQAEEASA